LANVGESGESGEYSVNGLANVGKFGESTQHGLANVGKSGESAQHDLANLGESGESDTFPKKAILASTRIRQKRQISGDYSNSLNSLGSGHCLVSFSSRFNRPSLTLKVILFGSNKVDWFVILA
jgi:hypothetical protein